MLVIVQVTSKLEKIFDFIKAGLLGNENMSVEEGLKFSYRYHAFSFQLELFHPDESECSMVESMLPLTCATKATKTIEPAKQQSALLLGWSFNFG